MAEMIRKLPISVFIIAKNEADRIGYTIKSVRDWVDEVLVVDSGSVDATARISENLGAKVIHNDWKGYGPQKVFGEKTCRNDWILNIDADEKVSPELAEEIKQVFNEHHTNKAYRLKIHALYPFQKKLPIFPVGTTQVRLYNRNHAGFKDSEIHDSVVLRDAEEFPLQNSVIHRSHRSHAHTVEKMNSYTDMQAEDLFRKQRNPSAFKIGYTPILFFLKSYILKGYIFYGIDGYIHSWEYALGRMLRLAKAREKCKQAESSKITA